MRRLQRSTTATLFVSSDGELRSARPSSDLVDGLQLFHRSVIKLYFEQHFHFEITNSELLVNAHAILATYSRSAIIVGCGMVQAV